MRFECVSLLWLEIGCVRQQIVEAAVLGDEVDRALLANARHARHVVARVAYERQYVDDL